jgi:hypothetical protein
MNPDLNYPTTLRSRPGRILGFLLICFVFVAMGALASRSRHINWIGIGFFGVGAVVLAIQLLPTASYLKLETDRFTVSTSFIKRSYLWVSVVDFEVTTRFWLKYVVVRFKQDVKFSSSVEQVVDRVGTSALAAVGLPRILTLLIPDTYGLSAEELAALLNSAVAKARANPAQRSIQNESFVAPSGVV